MTDEKDHFSNHMTPSEEHEYDADDLIILELKEQIKTARARQRIIFMRATGRMRRSKT